MQLTKTIGIKALVLTFFLVLSTNLFSEGNFAETHEIKGKIIDKENQEPLIGATIYVEEFKTGTATDVNGSFLLKLPKGKYHLQISFIGYKTQHQQIDVTGRLQLVYNLEKESLHLQDVVISAEKSNENVTRTEMSVEKMKIQEVRKIPALFGEVDIIKAIQLLPGVQSTSEGSSGFSVRGGNMDQNLILIDEVPLYNASHIMGFFSVFNNDAVKDLELYKGDIPVAYGGRLSSLLNVRVKEGNNEKWHGTGGIGTISTRFELDGPLFDDRTTLMMAGRLFNAQLYLAGMQSVNSDLKGVGLYFYDLNAKLNHRIDNQNTVSLNLYNGWDAFNQKDFKFGFGNTATSASWLHTYSDEVASKFTFYYSRYGYQTTMEFDEASGMFVDSHINDYGFRLDNTVLLDESNTIKFGFSSIYHRFYPGMIEPVGDQSIFDPYELFPNSAIEWGIYGSNVQQVTDKLTLKYGVRFSIFQNVGPGTVYNYNTDHEVVDSTNYSNGDVYNVFQGLEPRIGAVYQLNESSSIKASYSRTRQYIHMASNSTGGTPFDIWVASNQNIQPQIADQAAIGYFRNFWFNQFEASGELYYKKMDHTIDFKDHAQLYLNRHIDGELRMGDSYSYGAEFQLKFNFEKLNGWVSYTLSKTQRDIPEINGGVVYNSPYDKPHDIDFVANYQLNDRWSLSVNWVFASGTPMTVPSGFYEQDNVLQLYYKEGTRNKARMPAYHRLDLGLTYQKPKKPGKRWESEWNFSIYNAYNRHNAWSINYKKDEETNRIYAEKTYLFAIIPSVTYNFKF